MQYQHDVCEEGVGVFPVQPVQGGHAGVSLAAFRPSYCTEDQSTHPQLVTSILSVALLACTTLTFSSNIVYLKRQPEHPPDDLGEEIDALRQQIAELELQPTILLESVEHSRLLILARSTVFEGETVYAQSVVGGSELGDQREANPGQQISVHAWLHRQFFTASQKVVGDVAPTKSTSH